MKWGWQWVSFATVLFACNADQFTGADASGNDASGDAPIVSGGDAGDAGDASVGCGDTQSSSANCGACGHSCGGGACVAGVCQPDVFAVLTGRPIESLALDDTNVYLGADVIYGCARGGCSKTPTAISGSAAPAPNRNVLGIAPFARNNAGWLLYANYGDPAAGTYGYVGACAVADCLNDAGHLFDAPKALSASQWGLLGFTGVGYQVKQASLDGGSPSPSNLTTFGQPVLSTAIDANGNIVIGTGGGVYACSIPNDTCGSPLALTTSASAFSVAILGNTVYWTNLQTNGVESCTLSGCNSNPTVLFTANGTLGDLVVTGAGKLYAALNFEGGTPASNSGSILTCDVTTDCSNPTPLATKRNYPWHLAAGNQVLFWTEGLGIGGAPIQSPPYQVVRLAL
jgi:hypothetical protein